GRGDRRTSGGGAGLKGGGGPRGNAQAIPERGPPIEGESRIGFGEMIVTADLDRPIAGVGNSKRDGCSILVQDDLAGCWKNLARYHVGPRIAVSPAPTRAPAPRPTCFTSGKNCGASRRSNMP